MDENDKPVICWETQLPPDPDGCPLGRETCDETCDEYFVAYWG